MAQKILLIDDEVNLAQNLADFLEDYEYEVATAVNGEVGLEHLLEHPADLTVVDLNMPVMDGYEFIRHAKKLYPKMPVVALSGVGMIEDAIKAIRNGAWDFVAKPLLDMQVMIYTIEKCMEKVQLLDENEKYKNHLEELVELRTSQLQRTKKQIVDSLGVAAEFKDTDTGYHVSRVAQMTYVVARGIGLDDEFATVIKDASTMHDVGKIGIDDAVLLKKGKLNPTEWAHMQQHVCLGYHILDTKKQTCGTNSCASLCTYKELLLQDHSVDLITVAKKIALFHHERWDGNGYLLGLAKDEIPIEARIVSLVDFYDAVSSKRPYKEAFPENECQKLIKEGIGSQFDPQVVETFFANLDAIHAIKYKTAETN